MNSAAAGLNSTANGLLEVLPGSSLRLIEPYLASVSLAAGIIVHEVGDEIDHIYFPTAGIASLQMIVKDGRAIDTAMLGRDGAIGSMAGLGPCRSVARCVVRSNMTAFKISAVTHRRAAAEDVPIQMLIIHYQDKLLSQTQTSAARYASLSIDERLAGCLLDASRLLASDRISLTQESLAEMLAVRRTSVTEACGKLKDAEVISCSRGEITILDRARLLKLSQAATE